METKKTVKAQAAELKEKAAKVVTMLASNQINIAQANNVAKKLQAAAAKAKAATLQKAFTAAAAKVAKAAADKEAELKAAAEAAAAKAAEELNRRKEAAAAKAAEELSRRRENLAACTEAADKANKEAAAAADKAAEERKAAAKAAAAAKEAAVNLAYSRTLHGIANDDDTALVGLDTAANNAAAVLGLASEALAELRKDKAFREAFKAVHEENKSLSHALKDMLHSWDKYAAVFNAANVGVKKDNLSPKLFAAEAVNPFLLVATAKGIKVGLLGKGKVTAVTAWNSEKALLVLVANSILNKVCTNNAKAAAAKEAQYSLILNAATALQAAAAAKATAKAANSKAAAKAAAVGKANDIATFEAAAAKADKAAADKAAAAKVAADKAAAAKEAAAAANKAQAETQKAATAAAKEAAKIA